MMNGGVSSAVLVSGAGGMTTGPDWRIWATLDTYKSFVHFFLLLNGQDPNLCHCFENNGVHCGSSGQKNRGLPVSTSALVGSQLVGTGEVIVMSIMSRSRFRGLTESLVRVFRRGDEKSLYHACPFHFKYVIVAHLNLLDLFGEFLSCVVWHLRGFATFALEFQDSRGPTQISLFVRQASKWNLSIPPRAHHLA